MLHVDLPRSAALVLVGLAAAIGTASLVGSTGKSVEATGSISRATDPPPSVAGLVILESRYGPAETFRRLEEAVDENLNLRILARVDHGANAAGAGLELRETRLLIFGNPRMGTPLMRAARTTAVDLPQKMLVWADAGGTTRVAYNDPAYLARRHGIEGRDDLLGKMEHALRGLAETATGRGGGSGGG